MKTIFLTFALIFSMLLSAQGGWTKITEGAITTFTTPGFYKGAAWVDINNDGYIDLFAMSRNVFLNNGDGTFTQLTGLNINPTPLQAPGGCSWGDLDNDGDIDFITAQNPSEIYLNNGDNTFQNITATVPELAGYASWGCAMADSNNDGKLDLLYAQAFGFHGAATPYPCRFLIQNTDSVAFTAVTGFAFTDTTHPYTVPYFDDYDMDGDMDIFVATGPGGAPGPDFCYKNLKTETGNDLIEPMTAEPWAANNEDGQCYNFIDYDNDGDLDVCLTNYAGVTTRFYKNNGNGNYEALTTPFTSINSNLSNDWGDFDNDGDLDVIISNDTFPLRYFTNNGDGTFTEASETIAVASGSSGVANGDYDNDGDLDVFVHGNGPARSLWRNDAVAGNRKWVNYTLKGVVSNKSAIGAFVKIKATINGNPVWQLRHITAQNSFQGQNDLRVHFGLNDATVIDSLVINWPSGIRECYINKNVNQFETLIEGNGMPLAVNHQIKTQNIKIYPNPAASFVNVTIDDEKTPRLVLKIADATGRIVYKDTLTNKENHVPVGSFSSGTYLFIIETDGIYTVKKVLVAK